MTQSARPSTAYVFSHTEVTRLNLEALYPHIVNKVRNASHIAIDFEFTGLVGRSKLKDIHHHYLALKKVVEQHTVVSFGLSIAKEIEPSGADYTQHMQYEFDNLDFLTLNQGPLLFDKGTAQFLASTGFDFNKLFTEGIPFQPPADAEEEEKRKQPRKSEGSKSGSNKDVDKSKKMFQGLMKKILELVKYNKIPLIFHNGLHDIAYLYHSFIEKLPDTFPEFLSKVAKAFPSGVYDTKVLAFKEATFNATFLGYLFARCDRIRVAAFKNSKCVAAADSIQKNDNNGVYFDVRVNDAIKVTVKNEAVVTGTKRKLDVVEADTVEKITEQSTTTVIQTNITTTAKTSNTKKMKLCKDYAMRGYCPNREHTALCEEHNIQLVIDQELGPPLYPDYYACNFNDGKGAHSAYFDAYMTAFFFCHCKHTLSSATLDDAKNKISIDFPPNFIKFPSPPARELLDDSQQRLISSQISMVSSQLSASYSSQTSTVSSQE